MTTSTRRQYRGFALILVMLALAGSANGNRPCHRPCSCGRSRAKCLVPIRGGSALKPKSRRASMARRP